MTTDFNSRFIAGVTMKKPSILYSTVILLIFMTLLSCEWESTVKNDDPPRSPILNVPSEHSTLASAIEAAEEGDTIVVADGTYSATSNFNLSFEDKQLTIRSENGPDYTIFDLGTERAFDLSGGDIDTNTVIEGFTFKGNGNSTLKNGGIISLVSASPKIVNCVFLKGRADYGAAVYCNLSAAIFDSCSFIQNNCDEDGGAIYATDNSQPKIRNCTFTRNRAMKSGGAIYCNQAAPTFSGCLITHNTAVSFGGGLAVQGASPRVEDCVLISNSATSGGGFHISTGSNPIINNCTLSGNGCSESGSGIYAEATSIATVKHTIIAFGSGGEPVGFNETTSEPHFTRSNIYGNNGGDWVGGGMPDQLNENDNFSDDPLFCDKSGEDMGLQDESTCLPENNSFGERVGAFTGGCDSE